MSRAPALSVGALLGYGAGAISVAAKDAAVVHFLAFYYTQVIGLPGWLYGLSAFLAQAIDAFADPVLGTLSDNPRTRWGRRHPWMAASALPIGVGFVLLFAPPSDAPQWAVFLWITFVQTALAAHQKRATGRLSGLLSTIGAVAGGLSTAVQ